MKLENLSKVPGISIYNIDDAVVKGDESILKGLPTIEIIDDACSPGTEPQEREHAIVFCHVMESGRAVAFRVDPSKLREGETLLDLWVEIHSDIPEEAKKSRAFRISEKEKGIDATEFSRWLCSLKDKWDHLWCSPPNMYPHPSVIGMVFGQDVEIYGYCFQCEETHFCYKASDSNQLVGVDTEPIEQEGMKA